MYFSNIFSMVSNSQQIIICQFFFQDLSKGTVLGCISSGMGARPFNKLAANMNIPSMYNDYFHSLVKFYYHHISTAVVFQILNSPVFQKDKIPFSASKT